MNDLILPVITILLILGLIYYMIRRASKRGPTATGPTVGKNNANVPIHSSGAITSDVTHEDVVNIIQRDFPGEQHTEVIEAVNECKISGEYRDTVQLIILRAAEGNMDKVREYVKIADKVPDYRDLALALMKIKSKQPK